MSKWNLIIDVALCQNCNNCVLATKDELVGNSFDGYTAPHPIQGRGVIWLERQARGTGHMVDTSYRPSMCQHCDEGPCLEAGSDGAVRKRPDGIVVVDPIKAKGRRDLLDSCPYGAMVWNEEQQLPQNWFFDAHLLDQGWSAPRCVGVCPTQAIEAVKLSDIEMDKRIDQEGLEHWSVGVETSPRVHYKNLSRFNTLFVGGSVHAHSTQGDECIAGAEIRLTRDGRTLQSTFSDAFGDFKFDSLPVHSGTYLLEISAHPYQACTHEVTVEESSIYLDSLELDRG